MANTKNDVTILDGLSQQVLEFFKKKDNFSTLLLITYGPRVTRYTHEGLYASPADKAIIQNPASQEGLLRVFEASNSGQPIYRRIIDYPLNWKPWLQKGIKRKLGAGWADEMVKLEDKLYYSYSDGIVRAILEEDMGILRLTNSDSISEFKEFTNKYIRVADAANLLFPYLRDCLQK